jgi:predicted RNase H-like nuclease
LINTTKQVKEELSAPEFAGIKIPEIVEKIVDVDVSLKQQADVISTVPETTSKPREQIPTDYQTSRTPDLSGI